MSYRKSRLEQAQVQKKKTRRLVIVACIVLLVGMAAGVGLNVVFGKNPVKKEKKTDETLTDERQPDEASEEITATTPKPPVESRPEFSVSQAMAHIFAVCEQVGPRPAGSVRESTCADYIVGKLGEYGYTVEEQPFTMADGFGSRNIIGTRRGTREGFVFVIGAHYDSAADSKGAVNNASGVGVVLELARVFSDQRLEPTIKFVFFGANRPAGQDMDERLQGARRYVEMLGSMEKKDVIGAISVDSVGQGEILMLRTQEKGLQRLKAKLETFAREREIQVQSLKATDDSDNIPFEDAEMPAVWIEWCDSGGKLVTDEAYNSVVAGKVEAAGNLVERFLNSLTSKDLEELKY